MFQCDPPTYVEFSGSLSLEEDGFDDEHPRDTDESQEEEHYLDRLLTRIKRLDIVWPISRVVHQEHVDEIWSKNYNTWEINDIQSIITLNQ